MLSFSDSNTIGDGNNDTVYGFVDFFLVEIVSGGVKSNCDNSVFQIGGVTGVNAEITSVTRFSCCPVKCSML